MDSHLPPVAHIAFPAATEFYLDKLDKLKTVDMLSLVHDSISSSHLRSILCYCDILHD